MGTMKRSLLRAGLAGLLGLAVGAVAPHAALAQANGPVISSDAPAGLVVFPKLVVDTTNGFDTIIELSNTNDSDLVSVHCFYVNALGTCSSSGAPCLVNFDCPGAFTSGEVCDEAWRVTDFRFTMTREQPIGWLASEGLQFLPCDPSNPDPDAASFCEGGQQNANLGAGGSSIPPTDDPFLGELKCVQIDGLSEAPVAANDLIGRATVHEATSANGSTIDVATYNAIGIQAGATNDGNSTLCLGANATGSCVAAEYASCPSTLILNHLFDGAAVDGGQVRTALTLVPCTQSEAPLAVLPTTTAQFLVFNEFEQRYSASTGVTCYSDLLLTDIDTRASFEADDVSSIFWIGTQGTLGGQTRIRGVATDETEVGHGLLGLATETRSEGSTVVRSSSANLHFVGVRQQADLVEISVP